MFKAELERKKEAFIHISRTEATCREFISPFLTTAVQYVQRTDKTQLQLKAEETLNGSRAYGVIDYTIESDGVVIIVNEVKKDDTLEIQGAAQNIAQMHSAVEVKNLLLSWLGFSLWAPLTKPWLFPRHSLES